MNTEIAPSDKSSPNSAPDDTAAIFRRLRQLKRDLRGANKHDQATTLISACILEGLSTRVRIVRALVQIGLSQSHVVIMLERGTGGDPNRYNWQLDLEGRYSLHVQP